LIASARSLSAWFCSFKASADCWSIERIWALIPASFSVAAVLSFSVFADAICCSTIAFSTTRIRRLSASVAVSWAWASFSS
jgi:hypothetical protein